MKKNNILTTFDHYIRSESLILDGLVGFLGEMVSKANNPEIASDDRLQYDALASMFSRYIRYLDLHDVAAAKESVGIINHLEPTLKTLKLIDSHLKATFPTTYFDSECRIKALHTYMEKIWRNGRNPLKSKTELNDLVALRFTLKSTFPQENIANCYYFAEEVIPFLNKLGFEAIDAKPVKDPCSEKEKKSYDRSIMYIPNIDEIPKLPDGISSKVKDYILSPKTNYYQGLHIIFYNALMDVYIEVQIKTDFMLDLSEHHEASHSDYKENIKTKARNSDTEDVEDSEDILIGDSRTDKIDKRIYTNLYGFRSRDGISCTDTIGLFKPRVYKL